MGMATKLALVGAVGAAALAALGAATAGYKYFFDPDQGEQRRNTAVGVVTNAAKSYGLDGMGRTSMKSLMESLASAK